MDPAKPAVPMSTALSETSPSENARAQFRQTYITWFPQAQGKEYPEAFWLELNSSFKALRTYLRNKHQLAGLDPEVAKLVQSGTTSVPTATPTVPTVKPAREYTAAEKAKLLIGDEAGERELHKLLPGLTAVKYCPGTAVCSARLLWAMYAHEDQGWTCAPFMKKHLNKNVKVGTIYGVACRLLEAKVLEAHPEDSIPKTAIARGGQSKYTYFRLSKATYTQMTELLNKCTVKPRS